MSGHCCWQQSCSDLVVGQLASWARVSLVTLWPEVAVLVVVGDGERSRTEGIQESAGRRGSRPDVSLSHSAVSSTGWSPALSCVCSWWWWWRRGRGGGGGVRPVRWWGLPTQWVTPVSPCLSANTSAPQCRNRSARSGREKSAATSERKSVGLCLKPSVGPSRRESAVWFTPENAPQVRRSSRWR